MKSPDILILTFCSIFFFLDSIVFGEARWRDGRIEFAVSKVNGVTCWTQKERDELVASFSQFSGTSPITVNDLAPAEAELNVSTCGLVFSNYSDYAFCLTNKDHLEERIAELQKEFDARSFLSLSALRKRKANLDWLKSYYQSLP